MPIYEYECDQCGTIEEIFQKFSDEPLDKCKHCSGKLHKLISQNSFHLKGSGWYVTDYAKNSKTPSTNNSKKQDKPDSKSIDACASKTKPAKDNPGKNKDS